MAITEFTGATSIDAPTADANRSELVTGNKTLVAADTGKTYLVKRGTSIFTLPATAVGLVYTFAYIGDNAGGQIQVSSVLVWLKCLLPECVQKAIQWRQCHQWIRVALGACKV